MAFLLKSKDGQYVANDTVRSVYTKDLKKARIYQTHQSAARDRAVTETIVPLDETPRA